MTDDGWSDVPVPWWWLSFCDPNRPAGDQFLGVAIVQGFDIGSALSEAWRLKINPGGEVGFVEIPVDQLPAYHHRNRLLSKDELVMDGLA